MRASIALASLYIALSAAPALAQTAGQRLLANPIIPVCPTSNCPAPPHLPTLATQVIHGVTTKGADQYEWLSTLGLYVGTGAKKLGDPISGQKVGEYIGVMQGRGAGTAWALNTDSVRNAVPGGPNSFGGTEGSGVPGRPGSIGSDNGTIGYELDFTNWDADSGPGRGAFTIGQYVHAQGSFTSLAAIYFDATMVPGKRAWDSGILFNGENVVRESTFTDWTSAVTSLTIAGKHRIGLNAAQANPDMKAVVMREGQSACFNGEQNCVRWQAGKLVYTNKAGKAVFSVDEDGNITSAGKITANGAP